MAGLDVLILDDSGSRHARLIQNALVARGAASERLNCADIDDWMVDVRPGEFRFRGSGSEWDVSSSTTVWYRRIGRPAVEDSEPDEAQLIREEAPHVLIGALSGCGVRWVDEPFDVDRAERKLFQLSTASEMNLVVPRSVVTNDSAGAIRMLDTMRAVAKPLSPGQGIAPFVDEVQLGDLKEFAGSPVLLQELILGASADLRVVVIGSRSWTWRRPRSPNTIDWRAEDPSGAGFEPMATHAVEREAIDLTRALGLTMSVQDWLETPDGLVFLEANPQGAWAFLDRSEEFIPDPLAAHLTDRSGEVLSEGEWPTPLKRVLQDLRPASKALPNDGAVAPKFAPPAWASVAARSSAALPVVHRANDEAKAGARAAEEKSARLVRTALTTVALATALIGYQLQFALERGAWWFLLVAPAIGAFVCLASAAFAGNEIDRVGFYRHATGQDLANPGPRDPIVTVIEQEHIGRRLAAWSSENKHTALMQARAWFSRGLVLLLAAGIAAATSWAINAADSASGSTPTENPAVDTSSQAYETLPRA